MQWAPGVFNVLCCKLTSQNFLMCLYRHASPPPYCEPRMSPPVSRSFVPAGKNTLRTTGIFCSKAFIAYLSGGKTPNRKNGAAYIARSVTFQHLMWRDSS